MNEIAKFYAGVAGLDHVAILVLRGGVVLVLFWIGGLKFVKYEGESIVPLVSNSPLMSFFYRYPVRTYRVHQNKEGELNPLNRAWNTSNGTYRFSHGLGAVILLIGFMIASSPVLPQIAVIGSLLLVLMSCTTLSFLITTPEAWVPETGDAIHGFPYLSAVGRLIIKDLIMLGAALVTMSDSAKAYLK
jgi:uncharacterized membrane protein YkgB